MVIHVIAPVLNWREQGIMADWCTQRLHQKGNPCLLLIGSNPPTLSDMAAQMWSSVRGSNQRGGDMLTGATVVHRKEALMVWGVDACRAGNPS